MMYMYMCMLVKIYVHVYMYTQCTCLVVLIDGVSVFLVSKLGLAVVIVLAREMCQLLSIWLVVWLWGMVKPGMCALEVSRNAWTIHASIIKLFIIPIWQCNQCHAKPVVGRA